MKIRHHKAYGNPYEQQDPLPGNWMSIAEKAGRFPRGLGTVEEGKLYRSGMVWPHQVKELYVKHGIQHVLSLIEGDWLQDYYDHPHIMIHQFPFLQRRELTFDRVKDIVDVINGLEQPAVVHCLRGATKTGMVCAGYRILKHGWSPWKAIAENILHGDVNISAVREIRRYSADGQH